MEERGRVGDIQGNVMVGGGIAERIGACHVGYFVSLIWKPLGSRYRERDYDRREGDRSRRRRSRSRSRERFVESGLTSSV